MTILPFTPPKFAVHIPVPDITITLDTPSKGDFYALAAGADAAGILSKYTDAPLTPMIAEMISEQYMSQLRKYRADNMDFLEVPAQTDFSAVGEHAEKLPCMTAAEHIVYEHTGLDFARQCELPVTEYWLLLADAVKMRILSREDGEEYLEQCWHDMHRISDF